MIVTVYEPGHPWASPGRGERPRGPGDATRPASPPPVAAQRWRTRPPGPPRDVGAPAATPTPPAIRRPPDPRRPRPAAMGSPTVERHQAAPLDVGPAVGRGPAGSGTALAPSTGCACAAWSSAPRRPRLASAAAATTRFTVAAPGRRPRRWRSPHRIDQPQRHGDSRRLRHVAGVVGAVRTDGRPSTRLLVRVALVSGRSWSPARPARPSSPWSSRPVCAGRHSGPTGAAAPRSPGLGRARRHRPGRRAQIADPRLRSGAAQSAARCRGPPSVRGAVDVL